MKIAVLNNSGNVGKSTICHNLLLPRIAGAELYKIETRNNDLNNEGTKLKGRMYDELITNMMISDDVIVDVGSSNIEEFLHQMEEYSGSHEDFDYFIIPVIPDIKQQIDSLSTIAALNAIGIEASKIKFIFNRVKKQESDDVADLFNEFSLRCKELGIKIDVNKIAVIYETTIFTKLAEIKTNLADLLSVDKDYDALIKQIDKNDPDVKAKRMELAIEKTLKRQAIGVKENLDYAFRMLKL
ncbi:transcriptional regulator [Salmonella enterica]|uniref:StbB family protein n=1 Tax=Salmonella enterica TaxID=28901 RepID=UPI0018D19789|nr:StbB family protein [Salmonella enterica]MBH0601302.1 transcriptional regulator [Salmonella enterica]MBH0654998.1 transcriptional regulator [Salmonella enterica]MBH0667789.1 transcriptional regulator [Salmonella enterica]MCU7163130.1 transcriptional regulator [Salmonella enterica]